MMALRAPMPALDAPQPHRARGKREATYRGNSNERGYTSRWRRISERYRLAHPLCRQCEREGRTTASTCVDHITPHRGDDVLMWDEANWQPLCDACHARKTASGQ